MLTTVYDSDVLLGGILAGFLIFILIVGIISYILFALIFYNTAKTNGLENIAYISWIPIVQSYVLFALGSKKTTYEEIKKDATKWFIIYLVLSIITMIIPIINLFTGIALLIISLYYLYRLFYRWIGETGMAVVFVIISLITSELFFLIYGLIKMKKPFVAE